MSSLNDCAPETSHSTFAAMQLDGGSPLVEEVKRDPEQVPVSDSSRPARDRGQPRQTGGKSVTIDDVAAARACGANDTEIHDTVLIAGPTFWCTTADGLAT